MGALARARRPAHVIADLTAAVTVATSAFGAAAARALVRRRPRGGAARLLTFEADYTLTTIRARGLEQLVTARDLDGFFDHVWNVHPSVGADAGTELTEPPAGPVRYTAVSPKHTMVEATIGRFSHLTGYPMLNFALSQRALLKDLDRLIRRERISILRASDPFYLGPLGFALARANHIPLVIRLIANYDMPFFAAEGRPVYPKLFRSRAIEQRVARFILRHADLVAAGNEDIARYAFANGARPERTTVFLVGNVIELIHFNRDPASRPDVRAELGLGDRPVIICVSRLEKLKHPEDFLVVLAEARLTDPTVAGVLVGDGSMRSELEELAHSLGVAEHLVFTGNREQEWVANALSSASVVVSPLTGRSLVEAALSGTPVVAYDTDWHSELVKDGHTGILVPYRNTQQMAAEVSRLLKDREYARLLGTRGREYTLEHMDPRDLDEHERQEYRKLLT